MKEVIGLNSFPRGSRGSLDTWQVRARSIIPLDLCASGEELSQMRPSSET